MNRESDQLEKAGKAADEFAKQTAVQSALLAGFAFTALTVVTYDENLSGWMFIAFAISASLTVGLELLSMFIQGLLSMTIQKHHLVRSHQVELMISSGAYMAGILCFAASLVLLAFLKLGPAAWPILAIAVVLVLAGAVLLVKMRRTSGRIDDREREWEDRRIDLNMIARELLRRTAHTFSLRGVTPAAGFGSDEWRVEVECPHCEGFSFQVVYKVSERPDEQIIKGITLHGKHCPARARIRPPAPAE